MKMKNAIKAVTLVTVIMFGTTFASAGIIVGGRAETETKCQSVEKAGIIVGGRGIFGDILDAIAGIIVGGKGEKETTCNEKSGILVSDRTGILVSDRTGILVSD